MDYIYVLNENNEKEKMEVVSIYTMSNSNYNYIIYKSEKNDYFIGKYLGENIVDLDTNLGKDEIEYAKGVLKGLIGE